jgi:hypothetical protein
MSADVRDLIVVGLGDSFSAGSGNSRQGLISLDYDNVRCTRSGRSGQAAAALALEQSDPKTSVTFIHLACGGARADPGMLRARNKQLPQFLELQQILPPDQAVDFVSFTIGGNDIGFSTVIGQLVREPDAPLTLVEREQLHAREQRLLLELRQKMTRVAACFAPGIEGQACVVQGPSGREDDLTTVTLPPIPVVSPERIVHVTYPDLTTRFVRDESGELVPDEDGNPQVEVCPSDAVEPPGDLTDGTEDGVSPSPGRAPYISGSEWAWGGATLLWPEDPAPNDTPVAIYPYMPETPGEPDVPLPLVNTLNSIVMESRARFGWSASERWWRDSRGHGYCTPPEDNWHYRIIFHPNDAGYAGKAGGLVAEMESLGLMAAQ